MIVILAAVMVPAVRIRAAGVSQGGNGQDEKQDQNEREKQGFSLHVKHRLFSYYLDNITNCKILQEKC